MNDLNEKKMLRFMMETMEGDIHTPIAIFQKLDGQQRFLLESSNSHHDNGRYSYLGSNPYLEVTSLAGNVIVKDLKTGGETEKDTNIIEFLKSELLVETRGAPVTIPPFNGGAIGYMGYDIIRLFENIGSVPPDSLQMPDAHFLFFKELYIFDHVIQKIHLLTAEEDSEKSLSQMKETINKANIPSEEISSEYLEFESNFTQEEFENMVREVKEAIVAGEVFQVVLSQRFKAGFGGKPFDAYRRLRLANPSPYMFYIEFGEYTILGSSPESLISVSSGIVHVNPIAGTRPRGKTHEEDEGFERSLLMDEKELAEHRMLVDLGRNDLGRVCEIGSIHLTEEMEIQRYQHVMHIASKVSGKLREGFTSLDALSACLPAGTVSGAPKIRAMELINDLENCKRGIYSGSIGFMGFGGDMDMALAIRTMIIKDGNAYVQAGAGIVYDSDPKTEYEETQNKARALMEVHRK
ncbi:anthranilate synthase component I [Peribacillus muralis]|uniref:Anthranilate synthase component 1 n=1 Tax=Peribacillus muralis TaxID=264697 RepID=A0A1B3XLQ9_9BACI|nr:anthranilate synthase component I [Peribacillus muralis]AOH54134.1 anthranilate synthase component I [Peribacillus muralis]